MDNWPLQLRHIQKIFCFIGMNRFRNKVVHGYIDVDAPTVYKMLQYELGDFALFFADVKVVIAQEQNK